MSAPVVHDDPFRLRVLKKLSDSLASINVQDGYKHDLAGVVFRGRDIYGDNDPCPMISILEPPLPVEQLIAPPLAPNSNGQWDLLIQGFTLDDPDNPTDPGHLLLADVKRKLAEEKARTVPGRAGQPDPFGCGVPSVVNGKAIGNNVVSIKQIGPGVVRPPEIGVSNKAYFWLTLTLEIAEDNSRPFM